MSLSFLFAIIIGLLLGLVGGGGSILTVPVLVYYEGINPVSATAYSLFIVGISALIGTYTFWKRNQIDLRTGIIFGIPSLISVYLTRAFVLPNIPDSLFYFSGIQVSKSMGIMILFAILMMLAAYSMLNNTIVYKFNVNKNINQLKFIIIIVIEGLILGLFTGLLGAGGGFLIIPMLVVLMNISVKKAIGTSLFIIAIKSLFGFIGDLQGNFEINWEYLIGFTIFVILGTMLGSYLTKYLSGIKLKKFFGVFILIMSIYIIIKELTFN